MFTDPGSHRNSIQVGEEEAMHLGILRIQTKEILVKLSLQLNDIGQINFQQLKLYK